MDDRKEGLKNNQSQTYFFGILDRGEKETSEGKISSEEKLKERFKNTISDFEHYLLSLDTEINEKCKEFVKLIALAFLPDKIVCCLKKNNGTILAVNIIKEVYQKITEDDNNFFSSADINNKIIDSMEITITVNEDEVANQYPRELKYWCWYEFDQIRIPLQYRKITKKNNLIIEFILPYKKEKEYFFSLIQSELIEKIGKSGLIKEKFLSAFDETNTKIEPQKLLYFLPYNDVIELGKIDSNLHKYTMRMVQTIEINLDNIIGKDDHQAWVLHHFKNLEEYKQTGIYPYIREKSGFYVNFIRDGKKEDYEKRFEKFSRNAFTFNELRCYLWGYFRNKEISDTDFENKFGTKIKEILSEEKNIKRSWCEDFDRLFVKYYHGEIICVNFIRAEKKEDYLERIKKFSDKVYTLNEIRWRLWYYFKDKEISEKDFEEIFDIEIKKILYGDKKFERKDNEKFSYEFERNFITQMEQEFKKEWVKRADKFQQRNDIGVISITRFTQLPEFVVNLSSYELDPRIDYYYNKSERSKRFCGEENEQYEKQKMNENFLFAPPYLSVYTTFPLIIKNTYWGVIMVFFGKLIDSKEEQGDIYYELHREVIHKLRYISMDAERGILSEFDVLASQKLLTAESIKKFNENLHLLSEESKKYPLVPDLKMIDCPGNSYDFCQNYQKNDIVYIKKKDGQFKIIEEGDERKGDSEGKFDPKECNEIQKIEKNKCENSIIGISIPTQEKQKCVFFELEQYHSTYLDSVYLANMAIAEYIRIGCHAALTEEEKRKLQLKTAALAIIMDTFSHNIAAHSLTSLINLFMKRTEYLLSIEKRLSKELVLKEINCLKQCLDGELLFKIGDDCRNVDITLLGMIKCGMNLLPELKFHPPLDDYIHTFLKYIQGKASFWGGIIRGYVPGGEIISWYDLIVEFVKNPLFIGTIADTENINKVEFNVEVDEGGIDGNEFLIVDITNLMDSANNPPDNTIEYNFVKKGKAYDVIKDKLKTISVFLPGGYTGKHSFYTIFENTIRNIKWCDKTNNKTAIFNIKIELEKNKIYSVSVWLSNESKICEEVKKENKDTEEKRDKKEFKYISQSMNDDIGEHILDDQRMPRMGGIFQTKICAALLFSNTYENVDDSTLKWKRKPVHPWVTFSSLPENAPKSKDTKGKIVTKFRIWKGERIPKKINSKGTVNENNLIMEDGKDAEVSENLRRFKILVAENEKMKEKAETGGIIRVVLKEKKIKNKKETYSSYYRKWLDKWLEDSKVSSICINKNGTFVCRLNNEWIWINDNSPNEYGIELNFVHPNKDRRENDEDIFYRRHGALYSNFLKVDKDENDNDKFLGIKREYQEIFTETLLTSIMIIDNRVHKILSEYIENTSDKDSDDVFDTVFNLNFFNEEEEGREKVKEFKIKTSPERINIIVIHLNFILSLKHEGQKYKEEGIKEFIDEYFKKGEKGYIFEKLFITTGRGRSKWYEIVKEDESLRTKVLYISPDALTNSIQHGVSIKDDFEIKHGIIKTLMIS